MEKSLHQKLVEIQQNLKVPKNQINKFGGYNYRSCEDIFEAAKPYLGDTALMVSDELVNIGDRYYVKATATLSDGTCAMSNTAYAREPETKKGMDEAQITGATSSYARKYALNGLFLLDDVKDADATNKHEEEKPPEKAAPPAMHKVTDRERGKIALEKIGVLASEFTEAKNLTPEQEKKFKNILSKKVFGTVSGTEINKMGFPILEAGLKRFQAIFRENTVESILAGNIVEPEGEDAPLFGEVA
ncbi:MAG TPA: ERF family protein [Candidatus Paceibacterota bacterium]|nr:ERF family protein [Candidatus Paceibacterota bacterium]